MVDCVHGISICVAIKPDHLSPYLFDLVFTSSSRQLIFIHLILYWYHYDLMWFRSHHSVVS